VIDRRCQWQLSLALCALYAGPIAASTSETAAMMIAEFADQAPRELSAEAGRNLWFKSWQEERSCTSCHSNSTTTNGSHVRTNKLIKPIAPSANPERLTDRKKINKWLLRNCKWTLGRECSAQEKGDVLLWLSSQ